MADSLSANPPRLGRAKLTSKEIPSDNAFKASHLDMKLPTSENICCINKICSWPITLIWWKAQNGPQVLSKFF